MFKHFYILSVITSAFPKTCAHFCSTQIFCYTLFVNKCKANQHLCSVFCTKPRCSCTLVKYVTVLCNQHHMLIEFRLSLCTTLQRRVYTENIPFLLCKLIHMQQTLSQNCPSHECIAPARERCWRVLHHHLHLRLQIQSSLPSNSIARCSGALTFCMQTLFQHTAAHLI